MLDQICMKHFPIPLPPAGSFKNQIGVVTGGTGGLGLATAAHLVNLGASEVIITSRNPGRAQNALETLDKETNGRSKTVVRVVELDMNRYDSVVAFTEEVKKTRVGKGGVDFVLLNAGVIGVKYTAVDEGWEQNLQVNVLSTTLISLLLLPWMKAERANRSTPSHLAIVGSSQHVSPDLEDWKKWSESGGILAHYNEPNNFPGGQIMYSATKLMVAYVANELAELAKGKNGRPEVIINTMCPGMVATDLARHYKEENFLIRRFVPILYAFVSKSPENGARTLITAGLTKESENGKFIRFYGSDEEYKHQHEKIFNNPTGRGVRASVWSEITRELASKVPGVQYAVKQS
ncbi:NAD(P)-binding protein [Xylariaceae sp. FL1272]|nr:NAD(P)-binding protein [Xylariaceae sp. FL1272]